MPSSTFLRRPSLYWQTRHLLLRFICLHEVAISALLCCGFSGLIFRLFFSLSFFICTSATAIVERCFPRGGVHGFSSLPCSRFNRERRHGKRVNFMFGLSHTCDAVYQIANVYSVQVLVFPHHATEAAYAPRKSAAWGSDVELEAMESEQTSLALSRLRIRGLTSHMIVML